MAAAEAASYADKGRAVGGPQPGRPTLPRPRSVRLLPTGSGRCGILRVALGEAAFVSQFPRVWRGVSGRYAAPPRDTVQQALAAAGEAGGESG